MKDKSLQEIQTRLLEVTADVARGIYMPDLENCKNIRSARSTMQRGDALRVTLATNLKSIINSLQQLINKPAK